MGLNIACMSVIQLIDRTAEHVVRSKAHVISDDRHSEQTIGFSLEGQSTRYYCTISTLIDFNTFLKTATPSEAVRGIYYQGYCIKTMGGRACVARRLTERTLPMTEVEVVASLFDRPPGAPIYKAVHLLDVALHQRFGDRAFPGYVVDESERTVLREWFRLRKHILSKEPHFDQRTEALIREAERYL